MSASTLLKPNAMRVSSRILVLDDSMMAGEAERVREIV
jgi:hypothetical protein